MKIAILGAGVSGLALARFLHEGGLPLDAVSLFEAGPVVGGLCRSKTVEGFTPITAFDSVSRAAIGRCAPKEKSL